MTGFFFHFDLDVPLQTRLQSDRSGVQICKNLSRKNGPLLMDVRREVQIIKERKRERRRNWPIARRALMSWNASVAAPPVPAGLMMVDRESAGQNASLTSSSSREKAASASVFLVVEVFCLRLAISKIDASVKQRSMCSRRMMRPSAMWWAFCFTPWMIWQKAENDNEINNV